MTHPEEFQRQQEGDRHLLSQHDKVQTDASTLIQNLWRRGRPVAEDTRDWILLPVLIIPGIASSGLIIEHSGLSNGHYAGQRVWMNATMLATSRMSQRILNNEELQSKAAEEGEDGSTFQLMEQACQVRSAWLHHMSLSSNMIQEREGNQVRPYKGLDGIEYLSDDAMTQMGSWVHAPVVKYLIEEMGYTRGVNVDGAPYDWRLPPSVTEERDGYLTNTMNKIEEMYEANNNLPIVLLCHSMGCKMGHYLLNFCLAKRGQEWIDKYIHTYMPVGAPHCGVSLAVRSGVTGKGLNDQVDMLLGGDDEGLVLYRSWGSGAWLMPRILPTHIVPSVMCRREGELAVRIVSSVQVGELFQHRKKAPRELRLTVTFRGVKAHTNYVPLIVILEDRSNVILKFDETFYFAVPYKPDEDILGELTFFLEEPAGGVSQNSSSAARVAFSQYTSWAPIRSFKKKISHMFREVAKKVGSYRRVAVCVRPWQLRVSQFMHARTSHSPSELETQVPLCCCQDDDENSMLKIHETIHDDSVEVLYSSAIMTEEQIDQPRLDQPLGALNVRVRYVPPPIPSSGASCPTPVAAVSPGATPTFPIECSKTKTKHFDVWSGHDLLEQDGFCDPIWKLLEARYEGDPLGPTKLSAAEAPPVKRIRSIYGVNLPTEVCAVYRRRPVVIVGDDLADSRYILDKRATFASIGDNEWAQENLSGYKMDRGRIFETPETLQQMPLQLDASKSIRRVCGDGTVPYWNLSHCFTWKDAVDELTVDELEQAGHRGILADGRFHALLKRYCKIRDPRISALLHSRKQYQSRRLLSNRPGAGGIGTLQAALQETSFE